MNSRVVADLQLITDGNIKKKKLTIHVEWQDEGLKWSLKIVSFLTYAIRRIWCS